MDVEDFESENDVYMNGLTLDQYKNKSPSKLSTLNKRDEISDEENMET